jgi:hypothetical protein
MRYIYIVPHQPLQAGPGTDDSIIYVVYQPIQCLPEFIVTYTEELVFYRDRNLYDTIAPMHS